FQLSPVYSLWHGCHRYGLTRIFKDNRKWVVRQSIELFVARIILVPIATGPGLTVFTVPAVVFVGCWTTESSEGWQSI
ncbi:MAG: hypothetical protein ACK5MO_10705, partial [Planctomyces sp.]